MKKETAFGVEDLLFHSSSHPDNKRSAYASAVILTQFGLNQMNHNRRSIRFMIPHMIDETDIDSFEI